MHVDDNENPQQRADRLAALAAYENADTDGGVALLERLLSWAWGGRFNGVVRFDDQPGRSREGVTIAWEGLPEAAYRSADHDGRGPRYQIDAIAHVIWAVAPHFYWGRDRAGEVLDAITDAARLVADCEHLGQGGDRASACALMLRMRRTRAWGPPVLGVDDSEAFLTAQEAVLLGGI